MYIQLVTKFSTDEVEDVWNFEVSYKMCHQELSQLKVSISF